MQTVKVKANAKGKVMKEVVAEVTSAPATATGTAQIEESPFKEDYPETASVPVKEEVQPQEDPQVQLLDMNKIVNSDYNPRKQMREETLLELADSIRQLGVLQPICVRPKEDGYEIVYGERRYWAAAMAELKFIPAIVRVLNDAEAEDAAITENLQREDVKPMEEAAAYMRAIRSGRHTIESLIWKFGKSEAYIRSRLKLCELIEPLAELLNREEISVGMAVEVAKYEAAIQQEVYNEHFSDDCRISWRNARLKEIAKRLYERYMTKLETYRFDKTECSVCKHNTANQVLFVEACEGGCGGCQNRECMIRKNEEFLAEKAIHLLKNDPRTVLAVNRSTPPAVLEMLEKEGYTLVEAANERWYDEGPQIPEQPRAEDFESEEEYAEALMSYEDEMAVFDEETSTLEFKISEGRVRKYAIILELDVVIRYEEMNDKEEIITIDDNEGERKVLVTVIPPSPLESLKQQDQRNREICYEHITTKMKELFYEMKVANKPLDKEEKQMFHYAVMQRIGNESRLKQCGIRPKGHWFLSEEEQFAAAGRCTPKQQAALMRAYLLDFFNSSAPKYHCTDKTIATRLMCRFADMNFPKQSQAVQQEYLRVYEKRKARLQEQIDAIVANEEKAARELSSQEEPLFEPEEIPVETPIEEPLSDDPQPEEPIQIPIEPDFEPDTFLPDEMGRAA